MSWASMAYGSESSIPTVVSGIGRCGSSMMMQMLIAGGLELTGDACPPLFEDIRVLYLNDTFDWLKELNSKHVLKMLDPGRFTPPKDFKCKLIWMERDIVEQCKSMQKYLKTFKEGVIPGPVSQVRKTIEYKTRRGQRKMKHHPTIEIGFEGVLADPFAAARVVKNFLGLPLNLTKMASVVLKRDPQCLDGFFETNKDFRERKIV